jgi:hypothetical protein
MMYRRTSTIFIITALALLGYSCSKSWIASDRREGFNTGSLRVYVRISPVMKNGEEKTQGDLEKEIINSAKGRCALYLKSHIKKTVSDREKINRVIMSINAVLENSSIRYLKCYDEYCEAFVDFNTAELEKEMKQANKGDRK